MVDLAELTPLLRTLHVLGVLVGGGAALTTDAAFAMCLVRYGGIQPQEVKFMRLGEGLVWIGVAILVVSGSLLMLRDPQAYLTQGRFLAKLCVVGAIISNGSLISRVNVPMIARGTWQERGRLVLATGAVSVGSWLSALLIGVSLSTGHWADLGYLEAMLGYATILALALANAALLHRVYLGRGREARGLRAESREGALHD